MLPRSALLLETYAVSSQATLVKCSHENIVVPVGYAYDRLARCTLSNGAGATYCRYAHMHSLLLLEVKDDLAEKVGNLQPHPSMSPV